MTYPVPEIVTDRRSQPVEYIEDVGGLYFRAICLENIGDAVPQHVHDHAHVTLVASGKARLWIDGAFVADIEAFKAIEIEANRKHIFQALEPMTRLACVHDVSSADSIRRKGL